MISFTQLRDEKKGNVFVIFLFSFEITQNSYKKVNRVYFISFIRTLANKYRKTSEPPSIETAGGMPLYRLGLWAPVHTTNRVSGIVDTPLLGILDPIRLVLVETRLENTENYILFVYNYWWSLNKEPWLSGVGLRLKISGSILWS